MKKYRINVNGNTYEVEVEEIGGASAPASKPVVTMSAPVATTPAPVPVSAPAPKAVATPVPAGAEVISAPMPGKIMSVKVKVGQTVKAGDLILTLEAMKMENEIFCGVAGTIKEIRCSEGAAVNPGDVLVVIG